MADEILLSAHLAVLSNAFSFGETKSSLAQSLFTVVTIWRENRVIESRNRFDGTLHAFPAT